MITLLKDDICPKCGTYVSYNIQDYWVHCTNNNCKWCMMTDPEAVAGIPKPITELKPKSVCKECQRWKDFGFGPRHDGSSSCKCGSIASGGTKAHCTCSACFQEIE